MKPRRRVWTTLLALAASLLGACGSGADAAKARRQALRAMDATIQSLVALRDRADEQDLELDDETERDLEAVLARARTLGEMADRSPVGEVKARARAIEFEARSLVNLWAERVDDVPAPVAARREADLAPELTAAAEEARTRYLRLRKELLAAYADVQAEARALLASMRNAQDSARNGDSVVPARGVAPSLSDAHDALERADSLSRSGKTDDAMWTLRLARSAIQRAHREIESDRAAWQRVEARLRAQRAAAQERATRKAASRARKPSKAQSLSPEALFGQLSPAVVGIRTFDDRQRPICQGTGFFVSKKGHIVTNHHVVADAHAAEVVHQGGRRQIVKSIVGLSAGKDLALIAVAPTNAPRLELDDDRLPSVGSKVYAIGNPLGLTNSLSEGMVSGHRALDSGARVIQTTAPISPGSSGGPLLSTEGKVVGVVFASKRGGQNLNMAIAVGEVRRLLAQQSRPHYLAKPGPRPDLYAAIAFSRSTGRYGYACDQLSRSDAERAARKAVKARDARAVMWVRNGWCAIAFGKDSGAYGVAHAPTRKEAEAGALREARKRTTNCYVGVTIHADKTLR